MRWHPTTGNCWPGSGCCCSAAGPGWSAHQRRWSCRQPPIPLSHGSDRSPRSDTPGWLYPWTVGATVGWPARDESSAGSERALCPTQPLSALKMEKRRLVFLVWFCCLLQRAVFLFLSSPLFLSLSPFEDREIKSNTF
uniref:Uncharacterized protein n=1 Tax=Catharus ustulatus TaxID=91951 RepID=A0A8C3V983_CATUS